MRTRTYVIAGAVIVAMLCGFAWYRYTGGQVFAPLRGWARYEFAGNSMEPTMHDGDVFFCESLDRSDAAALPTGSIVVAFVERRGIAKRVVAQQGDTVEAKGGELLLNGAVAFTELTMKNELFDFPAVTVPDGHVFVLGDNFETSKDSRDLGPIPYSDVHCLVHR